MIDWMEIAFQFKEAVDGFFNAIEQEDDDEAGVFADKLESLCNEFDQAYKETLN